MGIENCQIYLDKQTAIYNPGETVSGRVEFNFDSNKKIRGVGVSFKGQANVFWKERKAAARQGKRKTKNYKASETYFNSTYFLIGGENHDPIELVTGKHVYNISCVLPSVLPSSFEGSFGNIRYTIKVTLYRAWKFDQTLNTSFTVIEQYDINLNPQCREPAVLNMEKKFHTLFQQSGQLNGTLKLPRTGFVPGENIPMVLELNNNSDVCVKYIKLKLKQNIFFHAQTPRQKTRKVDLTLGEIKFDSPVKTIGQNSCSQTFTVPPLNASNLQNCNIIDLNYELLLICEVNGMHRNMYGALPITIGTIPFINMPMPIMPVAGTSQSTNINYGRVSAPPPRPPPFDPALMPPPSYEESQMGTITTDNFGLKNASWTPSYPPQNFNTGSTTSTIPEKK